ncbi:MAG: bifunctional serine/threonine-protein kinase/formylglycine-generating enzyme family protein [Candidatus Eremiobacterota bacterium]
MSQDPEDRLGLELAGRYRLAFYLGSGNFTQVYEAEILSIGRPVGRCALKLYQLSSGTGPERAMEILRRAAQLNHPSMLSLTPGGELDPLDEPGLLYCTTELCSSTLRRTLARQRTLAEEEVRSLVRVLAEGLAYLHEQKEFHGELRPSNVMQSPEGWRMSDHEIPRLRPHLIRLDTGLDTLHYSAPEQALGHVEPASDLWGLAILAHECLTGHHPFAHLAASSPTELSYRAKQEGPHLEDDLSPEWQALFRGCFRMDPAMRWTAPDVLGWLEGKLPEALSKVERPLTEPPPAEPPKKKDGTVELEPLPDLPPLGAPVRPRPDPLPRSAFALVGVFVVLLVLLVAVLQRLSGPKEPEIPRAGLYPVPFESITLSAIGRQNAGESGEVKGYAEDLGEDVPALELVQVDGGSFDMGCAPTELEAQSDEGPQHPVQVKGFFLGRLEVNQAQWRAVAAWPQVRVALRSEPFTFPGNDRFPVDSVSYAEAVEFCARLTQRTGRPYRLPTEAEWEYACRAGTTTPFYYGDTISPDVACYNATQPYGEGPVGPEQFGPRPVGEFGAANLFGLQDMHGNVQEWCQDFYAPYPSEPQVNPKGPEKGYERVLRGGSWLSYPWKCRSAARGHARSDTADNTMGFRVVSQW